MALIAKQRTYPQCNPPECCGKVGQFSVKRWLLPLIFLSVALVLHTRPLNSEPSFPKSMDENAVSGMVRAPFESADQLTESPPLQLWPPYQIVIFGEPRSGSTFMHQLLYAIVRVKTPPSQKVHMRMNKLGSKSNSDIGNDNFVSKAHKPQNVKRFGPLDHIYSGKVSVFISTKDGQNVIFDSNITSRAMYIQEATKLRECSLCEVDAYQVLFNLTDTDVQNVKAYMGSFEVLRQCCGLQMSRWERAHLHGCEITQEDKAQPDYNGACASVNKTDAELTMVQEPGGIQYVALHPGFNWNGFGDCAKFDEQIMQGKDFNGQKFVKSDKNCEKLKNPSYKEKKKNV